MMRAAGITAWSGAVQSLELPDPRELRSDEVLIRVAASGVGYREDVVRSGDWQVGGALPMALGVETAGTVTAVGSAVTTFGIGDQVLTHCVPIREQGAWAEQVIFADRVRDVGAPDVLDYHDAEWPERVRRLTGGVGVAAAARSGAA